MALLVFIEYLNKDALHEHRDLRCRLGGGECGKCLAISFHLQRCAHDAPDGREFVNRSANLHFETSQSVRAIEMMAVDIFCRD